MTMYRAPIDSGKGRVGAMIANAIQGGAQSVAGGFQERHRREQEAEALRREQAREAEAQRRYQESMDLQYGPTVDRGSIYQAMDKGPGAPTPQITVPGRTAPVRGLDGSPIGEAVTATPQVQQAQEVRPGVFKAGGEYRDFTQSHGHRVGQLQQQEAARAQAAATEQAVADLVSGGVPEHLARAVVSNQAFGKHHFDTEMEGTRQTGREALEGIRHNNTLGQIGARGSQDRQTITHRGETGGATAGGLSARDVLDHLRATNAEFDGDQFTGNRYSPEQMIEMASAYAANGNMPQVPRSGRALTDSQIGEVVRTLRNHSPEEAVGILVESGATEKDIEAYSTAANQAHRTRR
jgi:hypothetical protein